MSSSDTGSTGQSKWISRERGRAQDAGPMTAAMRALPTATPKALRIALVRDGKIVHEQIVRDRKNVTCGTNERCLVVVAGRGAPEKHALFEMNGDRYVLHLLSNMNGRIALALGVFDVAALCANGTRIVELDADARGKVTLGDTSIVFQHVDAPLETKPKLPLSVRRGLGIDWNLTVIAAFSFLVHFGIVGASYSDFADPVHDEESTTSVIDRIRNLPSPTDVETTPAIDQTAPTAPEQPTSPSQEPKRGSAPTTGTHAPAPVSTGVSTSEAEAARAAILLAYGDGHRVAVLDPNAPLLPGGVWVGRPGSPRDPNAPITTPDAPITVGPPGPAPTTTVTVEPTPIAIKPPALPPVVVNSEPPVGSVDPSPVAGLGGRARYCYQQALLKNPNQQGRVVIAIKVGPSGEVVSTNVVSSSGLDSSVGQCILGGANGLRFKSPGPAGGQLNVPFTFIRQ